MNKMDNGKTNTNRRKVLKTAGVAGAAAGASAWHKPMLNAVMTPTHAQTSMVIMGSGSSSDMSVVKLNNNRSNDLVNRAVEAIIPSAQAGAVSAAGVVNEECPAFTTSINDYTHCVSLVFPNGNDPDGTVNVTLNGPNVYYDYNGGGNPNFYYGGFINFSDTAMNVPLDNGEFSVMLENVEIFGSVNDAFTFANGTMIYSNGGNLRLDSSNDYCASSNAYSGAYWGAELGDSAGMCVIGNGLDNVVIEDND